MLEKPRAGYRHKGLSSLAGSAAQTVPTPGISEVGEQLQQIQAKGKENYVSHACYLLSLQNSLLAFQGGPSLPLASARPTRADHGCTFTLPAFQTCSTEDARKYSRLCSIIYANPRHTGGGGGQQELQQTQSNFSPIEESCMKSFSSKLDLLSKHKGQVLLGTWKGRSTMLSLQTVKS